MTKIPKVDKTIRKRVGYKKPQPPDPTAIKIKQKLAKWGLRIK